MAANASTLSLHYGSSRTGLGLRPTRPRGWSAGLGNLLRRELAVWTSRRFGLVQCLVWLLAINALMIVPLWVIPASDPDEMAKAGGAAPLAVMMLFQTAPIFAGIGVAILAQNAIVGERQLGTAAWILSKPVSRAAFVVSRLIALAAGTLVTVTLIPAAVFYAMVLAATGTALPLVPFAAGMALLQLSVVFYLTLTLLLGVIFRSRGPVVGIPIALLFAQQIVSQFVPAMRLVLPESLGAIAGALAMGQPVPSLAPIGAVALWSVLFAGTAVWRFGREEL